MSASGSPFRLQPLADVIRRIGFENLPGLDFGLGLRALRGSFGVPLLRLCNLTHIEHGDLPSGWY